MKLDPKKYRGHNVHDEKLNKWILENHVPTELATDWGCKRGQENDFGCWCEELDEDYDHYYDKYVCKYLVEEIPNLTEDEKEDLESLDRIRVYACPICGAWSVDGDNI